MLALALLSLAAPAQMTARPPTVVVVLCDDLGYGDVSPLNPASRIPTPAFHRLAKEGMTFTDAHTPSAVCTPTRYGLLTGRYAWRSRLKKGVLGGYSRPLIGPDRTTIADVMRMAGARTAVVGKWHLGLGWHWNEEPTEIDNFGKSRPAGQIDFSQPVTGGPAELGFDASLLIPASLDMTPYVYVADGKVEELPTAIVDATKFPGSYRGGEAAPSFRHVDVLDRIVEQAETLIGQESAKPLFLYVPLTSPHKPVLPHPRFRGVGALGPYSDFIVQTDAAVGRILDAVDASGRAEDTIVIVTSDFIVQTDAAVGRILDAVDASGRAEDTIVIVTSDNGSFMYRTPEGKADHSEDESVQGYRAGTHLANGPLRGTKADVWEAGHRVPMFVRWPKTVAPASVCEATVCLTDVMPTLADACGVRMPEGAAEDGVSLFPVLLGEEIDRGPVVHHSGNGMFAVREGRWKLVFGDGSGGREKPRGEPFGRPFQLFDLPADIGETADVAADHPDVVGRLTAALKAIAGDEVPL